MTLTADQIQLIGKPYLVFSDGTKILDPRHLCRYIKYRVEIEYDPDKERLNRDRHGIGFAGAGAIFDGFRIDDEDDRADYGETRYVTLGRIGPQVVVCVLHPGRECTHHQPEKGAEG